MGGRVGGRVFWAKRGPKSVWEVGSAVGSEVGSFGCGQEPEGTGRSGWRSGSKPKQGRLPLKLKPIVLFYSNVNNNYIIQLNIGGH